MTRRWWDPLNLVIDNSTINPVQFSWIGSCETGSNCISMTKQSVGFFCTDETCIRAANPESSNQGHFDSPSDVAVNATHIFVVDSSNGRIQIFNQTGFFAQQIGSQGNQEGNFNTPVGITIDSSGNFYVTDAQDRVQKFNSAGTLVQVWSDSINTQFEGFKEQFNLSPAGVDAQGALHTSDFTIWSFCGAPV